jgi:hypothetical protein
LMVLLAGAAMLDISFSRCVRLKAVVRNASS